MLPATCIFHLPDQLLYVLCVTAYPIMTTAYTISKMNSLTFVCCRTRVSYTGIKWQCGFVT